MESQQRVTDLKKTLEWYLANRSGRGSADEAYSAAIDAIRGTREATSVRQNIGLLLFRPGDKTGKRDLLWASGVREVLEGWYHGDTTELIDRLRPELADVEAKPKLTPTEWDEIKKLVEVGGPGDTQKPKPERKTPPRAPGHHEATDPDAARLLLQFANIVLEGVPGTGKTFALKDVSGALRGLWRQSREGRVDAPPGEQPFDSITFHPATSYEDFVEGIRPLAATSGTPEPLRVDTGRNTRQIPLTLARRGRVLWVAGAAPAKPEWFFEPVPANDSGWGVRDGFFLEVCRRAALMPHHAFVVLLDELNRANVPKVMGDLLTTIERSKRAKWTGSVWSLDKATEVKLPVSGRQLFVPENVFVVGTMNTSDRSVTPLDAALRRRFAFHRLEPLREEELVAALKKADEAFERTETSWGKTLRAYETLQDWLADKLGPDGMLGHSYLFDLLDDLRGAGSTASEPAELHRRTWRFVILPQVVTAIEAAGQEDLIPSKEGGAGKGSVEKLDEATGTWGLRLRRSASQSFLGSIEIKKIDG